MHFWIDKRSPQCGFGRSRVAASLHTGGSGLSFGHPPRRSGGHKSSSSSTGNSSFSATGNAAIQVHRQQHHHHQQPQQHATAAQYPHAAISSNNTHYRTTNYTNSSNTTNSNNNNSSNLGINRNLGRSNVATSHHYHNNNRQHGTGSHHSQQPSSNYGLPNSSNNNQSNLDATTQSLVSPPGNNLSTSLNRPALANPITITSAHQHAQRYRHPQFGNMSVRPYQPNIQQQQISSAITTTAQPHMQQQQHLYLTQMQSTQSTTDTNTTSSVQQNSITAAVSSAVTNINQLQQRLDAPDTLLSEHGLYQGPNQTANLTVELFQQQTSPRMVSTLNRNITAATMSPIICDYSTVSSNLRTTYTNSTLVSTTTTNNQQYQNHHQQTYPRRRRTTRSVESTDLHFLPLHLKCGIFASLVLAIAFIVGIKVYFDNHGTKFEVGLFWLLTATFVFAFCFVSICKVPRVLFASTSSSRSNSRDQTRDRCSMDETGGRSSIVNSIDDAVITGLQDFPQEQMSSININAQAGPPPYHIAILLPEAKAKEDITTVEESPPPSYDKILI